MTLSLHEQLRSLSAASFVALLCNLTYLQSEAQSCHLLFMARKTTPSNLKRAKNLNLDPLSANTNLI